MIERNKKNMKPIEAISCLKPRIRELKKTESDRTQIEESLRHQNEMLQTILDSIPVMVAFFDREGKYQLVNACWQSTLGWSLEEAMHKDILAACYPDTTYREYVLDYIKRADVRRKLFCDKTKRILRQINETCDNLHGAG